jgi:opacity protein-like surface antigen
MKIRLCGAMLVLFLFAGVSVAQVPMPPLSTPPSSEASFSFVVPGRDPSSPYHGMGGQFTISHYVNGWLGFQAEGDYLRTNTDNFRDIGGRVGAIARFRGNRALRPYVHALVGIAKIKASYLNPTTSFNECPSILAGAGLEFPISQHWRGAIGGDLEEDWTNPTGTVGRAVAGLTYRFGVR